ncbi:NAD-dependent epimerase/dehydratase family protein [Gordonia jinhuaensis]|nr:NAD-dependent epimerase/dehydratase family protein [Gordonia jinhuaensis]
MTVAAERPRVVMVTGAATFLGGYLIRRMARNPDIERVLAIDSRAPSKDMIRRMGRAEFVRVDIRRSAISKLMDAESVDTVVHAATSVMDTTSHTTAIKELNVIGTMQLCAACQRSPTVKRVVMRSSGMVYGSSSRDPSHMSEDDVPAVDPRSGYGRDLVDIESYMRGLSRRRPDMTVTILRPAAILGPRIHTRISRYLSSPVIPTAMGFEPRLQFLHEEDALAAMEHATLAGVPGTFNVAAEGAVTLTQALRRCGRLQMPVPQPMLGTVAGVLRGLKLARIQGDEGGYLTFGRVLDTTRMRTELGFAPTHTSSETLDDFIARRGVEPILPPEFWHSVEGGVRRVADRIA